MRSRRQIDTNRTHIMLTTDVVSGHRELSPDGSAFHPFLIDTNDDMSDKKSVKAVNTSSRANEHTIEKLLNCPSTSSPASSVSALITSTNPLPSSVVLGQLNKSHLPIDIIAHTLWLQHQHLQHKLNPTPDRSSLFGSTAAAALLHNNSSTICEYFLISRFIRSFKLSLNYI